MNLMKKYLLVTLLLLKAWVALAQSDDMLFYYPDGKPYKRECKNIADINADFDREGRIKVFSPMCWDSTRYDCFVVIGYKLFTNQPLWVFTNTSEKIPEFVNSFNYHEYLESPHFDHDIKQQIAKRTLTDEFIMEAFGIPNQTNRVGEGEGTKEYWTYLARGLVLTFEDGLVTAYGRVAAEHREGGEN